MKSWWNVIYRKLKCAAFVLKLEKAWYTYFSTALMSVLFGFRLHIAYKQCNIDFVISPEICILGVLTGQYFNILNTLIVIVKYFIYVCKLKNQIPVWKDCVEYIKYCKKIDFDSLYLCTPQKSNSLKCKWNSISSMLQWVWCFQCLILGHKYKAELLD